MVDKLGRLPPGELDDQSGADLLKLIKKVAGWSNKVIAQGVTPDGSISDVDENTVKGWVNRGVVPSDRASVQEFLVRNCASREIADAWWALIDVQPTQPSRCHIARRAQ